MNLKDHLLMFLLTLALASNQLPAQDAEDAEDEELLREAVQLIEAAKEASDLEDRQILQDLENKIPGSSELLKGAANRLQKELRSSPATGAPSETTTHPAQKSDTPVSATDVLGQPPTKAPSTVAKDESKLIDIRTYGSITTDLKNRIFILKEDVHVREDKIDIRCDKLEVHFHEMLDDDGDAKSNGDNGLGDVKEAIATGGMVIISGKDQDGNPVEARCKRAVMRGDKVYLRGRPEIRSAGKTIRATSERTHMIFTKGDGLNAEVIGPTDTVLTKPEKEESN